MPFFKSGLVVISSLMLLANAAPTLVRKSSLVDISVSAGGEAAEVHDSAEDVNMEVLGSNVRNLLEQVEAFAKSNERPQKPQQQAIKDMVTKELIPGLEKERDYAKGEVSASLDSFKKCNAQSSTGQEAMKQFGATTVTADRKSHADCRGREKTNHESRKGRCGQLDTFLSGVKVPAEIPAGRSRRAMVQYVKEMNGYFCPMEPSTGDMAKACNEAIKAHEGEKAKCDKSQATFELAFCTWRQRLIDTCSEATNCYKIATDKYEVVKTNTRNLVAKLKTEYSALEKIKCYLNVWLKDENTKTVSQDQYDSCNGAAVDASSMNVELPDAPPLESCPLTSVAKYPGTKDFVETEYSDMTGYAVSPIPCIGK